MVIGHPTAPPTIHNSKFLSNQFFKPNAIYVKPLW